MEKVKVTFSASKAIRLKLTHKAELEGVPLNILLERAIEGFYKEWNDKGNESVLKFIKRSFFRIGKPIRTPRRYKEDGSEIKTRTNPDKVPICNTVSQACWSLVVACKRRYGGTTHAILLASVHWFLRGTELAIYEDRNLLDFMTPSLQVSGIKEKMKGFCFPINENTDRKRIFPLSQIPWGDRIFIDHSIFLLGVVSCESARFPYSQPCYAFLSRCRNGEIKAFTTLRQIEKVWETIEGWCGEEGDSVRDDIIRRMKGLMSGGVEILSHDHALSESVEIWREFGVGASVAMDMAVSHATYEMGSFGIACSSPGYERLISKKNSKIQIYIPEFVKGVTT